MKKNTRSNAVDLDLDIIAPEDFREEVGDGVTIVTCPFTGWKQVEVIDSCWSGVATPMMPPALIDQALRSLSWVEYDNGGIDPVTSNHNLLSSIDEGLGNLYRAMKGSWLGDESGSLIAQAFMAKLKEVSNAEIKANNWVGHWVQFNPVLREA